MKRQYLFISVAVIVVAIGVAFALGLFRGKGDGGEKKKKEGRPDPTFTAVPYGKHPRQVLHFWKAASDKPTAVVILFHGGAWVEGTPMDGTDAMVPQLLKAKISVASVGYRFIEDARAEKVEPPVKAPMEDAARALQFVRSKADEWNIDKTRMAVSGTSAGGCMALWLAFHPDMADAASTDPIARQSTRVALASVTSPQTTLDPQQMKEWTPNIDYGAHALGIFKKVDGKEVPDFKGWLAQRDALSAEIARYSPYAHASADDPPVYMHFRNTPSVGQSQQDPTHSANFGVKLEERLKEVGVPCELVHAASNDAKHKRARDYLVEKLSGR